MVALKIDMVVQNVEKKTRWCFIFSSLLKMSLNLNPLKTFLIQVKETCIFSP